jgi:hypothetical protein
MEDDKKISPLPVFLISYREWNQVGVRFCPKGLLKCKILIDTPRLVKISLRSFLQKAVGFLG